jgi:hypothetical protein
VSAITGSQSVIGADDTIRGPVLVPAQPAPGEEEAKLTFTSPLLFWLAGVKGDVSTPAGKVDVDLSPGDVSEHTEIGFIGYFDLSKGKVGAYLMPTYINLSADGTFPAGKATLDTELWIVDFAAHYKFWQWAGNKPGSVDALAGGRYFSLQNELRYKATGGGTTKRTSSNDLFDPIIGLRYQQYFTKKFHVWVLGDVGGFDLSENQSRFCWQLMPLVGYDFTMPVIKKPSTFFAGYRCVGTEHEEGGPAIKTTENLKFHGVILGLNVELF